ncbi:hypothetical protein NBG4_280011 [Candidatus Sulfobium mesophilum]|uniref:Prepilin-type N-terminal cleavage/methylation domain-containing protein n=1 Tax=Candidatus Sulfobium mesophilum TaxID=2016548 RepID=A0A2U3QGL9_9BACT|nr:hypothetical protein NBG4_280011 [Candidatus Sulfobium mesophilum]
MEYRRSCIVDRMTTIMHRSNCRGVTLIELLVVITIVGLVIIAVGFEYSGWQGRYRIESQVKQLHSDLMNARARAMERKRAHFISFPAINSYTLVEDTNENNAYNVGVDAALASYPKLTEYGMSATIETLNNDGTIAAVTAATLTDVVVNFGIRGLISSATLNIDPATPKKRGVIHITSTANPDYDCIIIEQTRIITGQTNSGGECVAK